MSAETEDPGEFGSRGGGRSGGGGRRPPPSRSYNPPPPRRPMQPQHPGLMKQAGATAAGVAAGSVIGHGIGHMLFGNSHGGGGGRGGGNDIPCSGPLQHFLSCCEISAPELNDCLRSFERLRACSQRYEDYGDG